MDSAVTAAVFRAQPGFLGEEVVVGAGRFAVMHRHARLVLARAVAGVTDVEFVSGRVVHAAH